MQKRVISGIQQVGIGVVDADEAFAWYKEVFGMDIKIFADAAEAKLMLPYTGGMPHKRYAILAMNMQGGGGMEIWQYKSRTPQPAKEKFELGRPGISIIKIRCKNVAAFYEKGKQKGYHFRGGPTVNPEGKANVFLTDPWGNLFELIEDPYWYTTNRGLTGGICGVTISVSNMPRSVDFYKQVLKLNVTYNRSNAPHADLKPLLPQANRECHRVFLHSEAGAQPGAFGALLGSFHIELLQVFPAKEGHLFRDRFWGDLGFIHVCFDIKGYESHTEICNHNGYPLTVDSGDFSMGESAGRFSYNEDPDGTLLEYVETYKVPVMKKWGWFLNLKNRPAEKRLPNWMVKAMAFNRVK